MTKPSLIDSLDARIILALDADPSATALSLSRSLGVARNTIHARLNRLNDGGRVGAFSRRLDLSALGYELTVFVEISLTQSSASGAYEALSAIPEIVEVHSTTGDADLIAKVVARDTADLDRVTSAILTIAGVHRTSTALSLREVVPYRLEGLLERITGDRQAH